MKQLSTFTELRDWRATVRSVSFVPTMGSLHEGHLSLLRHAQKWNDPVVVSIYVNPLQFNDSSDFEQYPRNLDQDLQLLTELGVDAVFTPHASEMQRYVRIHCRVDESLNNRLCGQFRPGHFDGVATVVMQLFNLVQPTRAIFGLKDYQQCRVIKALSDDYYLPVHCEFAPTVREDDGLAMSSRNIRLSDDGRKRATALYSGLQTIATQIQSGERDVMLLRQQLHDAVSQAGLDIEYLDLYSDQTLLALQDWESSVLLAGAVYCDGIRLIDNILVSDVH